MSDTPPTVLGRLWRGLYLLATTDFFPNVSAHVRRFIYHPLGVLTLAALVSLVCGLFLHARGFVLSAGILAVIALGVLWPWLTLRGLSGSVAFDRSHAQEGETVEVQLTLQNHLPWAAHGLAVRGGFGEEPGSAVAGIPAAPRNRTALCRWPLVPRCRGVYPLLPPHLTTGFPFGLWENRKPLRTSSPLTVWPRTYPVGPIPTVGGDTQVEGNVSRARVGTSGDVLGVRPYRRGDSPRRIHWGQSARHDRLIVCELQSNARPVIQLVLDADPRVHVGHGPDSSREWAIRIVASLARGWLADGAMLGLAWAGHDIPAASGDAQIHRILDALAALPGDTAQPLNEVLACPRCRGFREGLQVIVTTDRRATCAGRNSPEAENQRWVLLRTQGFGGADPADEHDAGSQPWLSIESPDAVAGQLRGGWREARHGS